MKTIQLAFFIAGIGLSVFTSQAQTNGFITNGLIAYYPFDGSADDASGNGYNGTVYSVGLTTDRFGNLNAAYSFNGTSSYIALPQALVNKLAGTNAVSVSAWFQTTYVSTTYDKTIVAFGAAQNNEDFVLVLTHLQSSSGQYGYSEWGGTYNAYSQVFVADGNWHQGVTVYNDTNVTLYVDGVQRTNVHALSSRGTTGGVIGASMSSTTPEFWAGSIDDIRIYNRALSSQEVGALYATESPIAAQMLLLPTIAIQGTAGAFCTIQYKDDLTQKTWIVLTNIVLPTTNYFFPDTSAVGQPQRFYEVVPQ